MAKKEKSLMRQLIDERGIKDVAGIQALVKELTARLIQECMDAELEDDLGSGTDPKGDLHDQRHQKFQPPIAQGYEDEKRVCQRRRAVQAAISDHNAGYGKLDDADQRLGQILMHLMIFFGDRVNVTL